MGAGYGLPEDFRRPREVPRSGESAGGRMRVWAFHDGHACGYYRITLPIDAMAAAGHEVGTSCGWDERAREYRVIVGQRISRVEALPMWRRLRAAHRVVWETDDDLWSVDPSNMAAYAAYGAATLDAADTAIEAAHMVTVSTQPLAELLRQRHPNVRVLPNCIDGRLLDVERPRPDRVTVGWAGGDSHLRDLAQLARPLARLVQRHPDVRVHTIGTDFRRALKIPGDFSQWQSQIWDYYRALDFDIGVAPLVTSTFNQSKCIDAATRICTRDGVLRADAITPGMEVWRNGWRKVYATESGAARPGYLITLADGYQLRLTPEHRMLVNGQWVRADSMAPGDRIAMELEAFGPTRPVVAPWPADGRLTREGDASDGPRVELTPRWGRFLGAFAGDGSVGQSTALTISCDGQDADWIALIMDDLRAFGLNPGTEVVTTYDGTLLRRRSVRVASAHLLRVLASWGVTRPRASGMPIRVPCVPDVIWRSPRPVVAEFLAAYFEADGSCTSTGVQVVSKSEQLIRDVQRLLLLFGITSAVRVRTNRAQTGHEGLYWSCTLRRAEADVFAKETGFRSARKSARLADITSRPHSNAYRPMTWTREIDSIETCMVQPVDLQVEGQTFMAAGFVSHNSAIKAIEYAALGIPVIASDEPPYRAFVEHGVSGFLVRRDHEWLDYLTELVSNPELRVKMGAAAKERAAECVIQDKWHLWAEAYASLD